MQVSLPVPSSTTGPGSVRRVQVVAHRGASASAPENTLAAIRRAVAVGVDLVEVDVRRTKDGALVLMHDSSLERTTNVRRVFPRRAPWHVGDFTYDEVIRLDAGSWKGAAFVGEPVPSLGAAIEAVRGSGAGLLLELKSPGLYPGLVTDVVAELRTVPGYLAEAAARRRLVVQSFDFPAMKTLKVHEPSVPVALVGAPTKANLPALATWADQVNPSQLHVHRRYVELLHGLGLQCHVWTVDRPFAMRRVLRMGVDGLITNRPEAVADLHSQGGSAGSAPAIGYR